jgi:hypothetical protein
MHRSARTAGLRGEVTRIQKYKKERGELGAFLRRNIYFSMLGSWRKQLASADRAALGPKRRGPKPDAAARQIKHLNRDVARLQRKLERAELIIDAQKNCACTWAADRGRDERGRVMLAVTDLATHVGMKAACRAFAFNPGYVYRDRARQRGVFTRHGTIALY